MERNYLHTSMSNIKGGRNLIINDDENYGRQTAAKIKDGKIEGGRNYVSNRMYKN